MAKTSEFLGAAPPGDRIVVLYGDRAMLCAFLDRFDCIVPAFAPAYILHSRNHFMYIGAGQGDEQFVKVLERWYAKAVVQARGVQECVVCCDDAVGKNTYSCSQCFSALCIPCLATMADEWSEHVDKVVKCPVCRHQTTVLDRITLKHGHAREPGTIEDVVRRHVRALSITAPDFCADAAIVATEASTGVLHLLRADDDRAPCVIGRALTGGDIVGVGILPDPRDRVASIRQDAARNAEHASGWVVALDGSVFRLDDGFNCVLACLW